MTNAMITWGLVLLVGMLATHFLGIDQWTAWVVWLVVIFVGSILLGRTMKKAPRDIMHMWMVVNLLGALLTIAFLAGTIEFDASKVMAIWFILFGAASFAGAHATKNTEQIFMGLMMLGVGIALPVWFNSVPFLVGGLFLGLPHVISGLLKK